MNESALSDSEELLRTFRSYTVTKGARNVSDDGTRIVRDLRWRYRLAYKSLPRSARTPLGYAWRIVMRPIRAIVESSRAVRMYGNAAASDGGGGLARQWFDLWWIRTMFGIEAELYYAMRCFEPQRRGLVPRLLRHRESRRLLRLVVADAKQRVSDAASVFDDKLAFESWARSHRLATAQVILSISDGEVAGDAQELPGVDLFSKPRDGTGGRGALRWRYNAEDRTYSSPSARDGSPHTAAELVDVVAQQSLSTPYRRGMLVQRALDSNPGVSAITPGALATARIVTVRWPSGRVEIALAIYRMPAGSTDIDNFDAGGLAAPIDLASGRLGAAVVKNPARLGARISTHPVTGAPILGTELPDWREALELARRAHGASPVPYPVLGWDIALTTTGVVLLEGNCSPSATLTQLATGTPLGDTAWASCLLAYLQNTQRAWATLPCSSATPDLPSVHQISGADRCVASRP